MTQPAVDVDAKARLLDAARRLFARHGFDGASVRDITAEAGVNLAGVTYHYGSKEELYHAVLVSITEPLAERMAALEPAAMLPLEKIETLVRSLLDHYARFPEMPALIVRELAGGGEIAPPLIALFSRGLPFIAGVIAQGQKDGSIRPGDPALLALSTMAQPVFLNIARPMIARVAGADPLDPALRQRVVEHVVATVRAALRNPDR
jgi:AcrR family transcriptional regulator